MNIGLKMVGATQLVFLFYHNEKFIDINFQLFIIEFKLFVYTAEYYFFVESWQCF